MSNVQALPKIESLIILYDATYISFTSLNCNINLGKEDKVLNSVANNEYDNDLYFQRDSI